MINVAIVGATGVVGEMFLKVLEEKKLNIDKYTLFASKRSAGKKVKFMQKDYIVKELTQDSFKEEKFDYALFSAGASTSEKYAKISFKTEYFILFVKIFFLFLTYISLLFKLY